MAKPRGRPQFKATAAMRRKVTDAIGCGISEDDIARAIGCSTPTLRQHFAEELLTGRAVRRVESVSLLWKSARAGNVSAQKKIEEMTGATETMRPPGEGLGAGAGTKEPKLGKKDQAEADARTPDTSTPMGELMARRLADAGKVH